MSSAQQCAATAQVPKRGVSDSMPHVWQNRRKIRRSVHCTISIGDHRLGDRTGPFFEEDANKALAHFWGAALLDLNHPIVLPYSL